MTHGRANLPLHLLSPEEVYVLSGIGEGLTHAAIAKRHSRTRATICSHVYRIKAKLLPGHDASEHDLSVLLARIAIAAGYVSVPEFPPPRSE